MEEEQNKKKVLVVDDDDNLRRVLTDKLKASGFEVINASNGEEGLEKALAHHPDIILLDVMMPIMNGQVMLSKLREDEWGEKAKVIMLSVIEDSEVIAQAVVDRSLAYFIKTDQSMDDIVKRVKAMLED
ncbi:MAG: response regulator [Parcubacteria group bacterium]|jgi:DNA-binding response OmpR family regulator|nr:response regulator [Parcubacteria group bacterium]